MATDQGVDPAESQPPFFSLGLIFCHASKQSSCHGHVVSGTSAKELLQAGGLGLQHRKGLFGFKVTYTDHEIAPKL